MTINVPAVSFRIKTEYIDVEADPSDNYEKCAASISSMNADNNKAPEVHGSAPALPDAPSLAVQCVRALMERHGLPKYRQSAWLADATGLSYSQAHRRMTGTSTWSLEDIARVAELFGESLADVVSVDRSHARRCPARCEMGTRDLPVRALDRRRDRQAQSGIGRRRADVVRVGSARRGRGDRRCRFTASIGWKPGRRSRRVSVVAVLDDDQRPHQYDLRPLRGGRLRRPPVLHDRRAAFERSARGTSTPMSSTGSSARRVSSSSSPLSARKTRPVRSWC